MSLRKFPHARRFPRVYLHPSVQPFARLTGAMAAWDGGEYLPVYDLSHTGVAVTLPKGAVPAKGEDVRLKIRIAGQPEVEIDSYVARISDIIVAFEFLEVETEPRAVLENFLRAKMRGLHLRRIDPSLFAKDEQGGCFTHWFQGPSDTNILLWYESVYLKRAKIEIGDEWLEWETGPDGEKLDVLRTSGRASPFVARVLDMLSQVHDEERVLAPLFDVLYRSENRAS